MLVKERGGAEGSADGKVRRRQKLGEEAWLGTGSDGGCAEQSVGVILGEQRLGFLAAAVVKSGFESRALVWVPQIPHQYTSNIINKTPDSRSCEVLPELTSKQTEILSSIIQQPLVTEPLIPSLRTSWVLVQIPGT